MNDEPQRRLGCTYRPRRAGGEVMQQPGYLIVPTITITAAEYEEMRAEIERLRALLDELDEDDGQPDEMEEWNAYDPDC